MSTTQHPMGCDDRWRRRIDEVVLGRLSTDGWERLRGHLRGCEPCRDRYNRAVLVERMLHGGPPALAGPSPPELERIGASLFAAAETHRPWPRRAMAWLAPTPRWMALATVAAAVALVPLVARGPRVTPPEEIQARGGTVEVARRAGLRAFCLDGERVQALDPRGDVPRCARHANLKLTVTNPGGWPRVFLVGVDAQHAIKWYEPRPPESESVAAPNEADAPVGGAVRLEVNHAAGLVRIYALFSDRPVAATEVEAAVAELGQKGLGPAVAEALPLGRSDVLQRSLLIEVQP